ncbi:hypothetical protein M5K25_007333 [Dendrobium thyrsiflorum]|uniref:Uncharacterized protein n=1 Tax=Dendrobium thyrsiflorum TaxID=117978 RepID=A0ABD0VE42_DENTH
MDRSASCKYKSLLGCEVNRSLPVLRKNHLHRSKTLLQVILSLTLLEVFSSLFLSDCPEINLNPQERTSTSSTRRKFGLLVHTANESLYKRINNLTVQIEHCLSPLQFHLHSKSLRLPGHVHLHPLHPHKPIPELPQSRNHIRHSVSLPLPLPLPLLIPCHLHPPPYLLHRRLRHPPAAGTRVNDLGPESLGDRELEPLAAIGHAAVVAAGISECAGVGIGMGTVVEGFHKVEERPGRGGTKVAGSEPLGSESFAEFLYLMAALDGGLGGGEGEVGAAAGYISGDLFPVSGAEVAAAEGVPLVAIGFD